MIFPDFRKKTWCRICIFLLSLILLIPSTGVKPASTPAVGFGSVLLPSRMPTFGALRKEPIRLAVANSSSTSIVGSDMIDWLRKIKSKNLDRDEREETANFFTNPLLLSHSVFVGCSKLNHVPSVQSSLCLFDGYKWISMVVALPVDYIVDSLLLWQFVAQLYFDCYFELIRCRP